MSVGYVNALGVPYNNGVCRVVIHIGVGVWRCSFWRVGQCEGLRNAGRVTGTDSPLFLYMFFP